MISDLMIAHLQGFKAEGILDVGPGFSDFGRTAARVTGAARCCFLDCNREVLASQAQKAAAAGISAECVEALLTPAAIAALPGEFDLILCQEVLEHIEPAEAVAAALASKLRAGGRMIITVPTRFSERWLRFLNSGYMRDEPFGHVRQFDRAGLERLARDAGLRVLVLEATQPHYFLFHTWLFGTRVRIDGSTGKILTPGWRTRFGGLVLSGSRRFFTATGARFWGRVFPRNYFLVAEKGWDHAHPD